MCVRERASLWVCVRERWGEGKTGRERYIEIEGQRESERRRDRERVKEGETERETEGETEGEFIPASYVFRLLCQSEPRYLEIARN